MLRRALPRCVPACVWLLLRMLHRDNNNALSTDPDHSHVGDWIQKYLIECPVRSRVFFYS